MHAEEATMHLSAVFLDIISAETTQRLSNFSPKIVEAQLKNSFM